MTAPSIRPGHRSEGVFDLDPSLVERQTYATRRRRHLLDTTAVVVLVLALAAVIRADLIVPQLPGGLGRPAMVVGFFLALGWVIARLHPRSVVRGPQPLRWAAAAYLGALLLAYAAGQIRGLTMLEANGADRAMLATVVFLGVALTCADTVPNRSRLDDLLRALVGLATFMAVIGIAQSLSGLNIVNYVQIPLLQGGEDADLSSGFRERGAGFIQVRSTARHYIEFSAVLAMALPIAIHLARFNRTGRARQWGLLAALSIGATIPLTLSRTGILAAAVGLIVLALFWTLRTTFNVLATSWFVLAAMVVFRPGVLGTIRSLFTGLDNDPSIQGRTEDYDSASAYFAERPFLGRGPGTFIPTIYDWIDNEWLLHLITTGIIGTAALAALHITAVGLALVARSRAVREQDRDLCACLVTVQVMAALMSGTYDTMSFTTHLLVLAVLTGAAGAMWRFTHPARQVRSAGASSLGGG